MCGSPMSLRLPFFANPTFICGSNNGKKMQAVLLLFRNRQPGLSSSFAFCIGKTACDHGIGRTLRLICTNIHKQVPVGRETGPVLIVKKEQTAAGIWEYRVEIEGGVRCVQEQQRRRRRRHFRLLSRCSFIEVPRRPPLIPSQKRRTTFVDAYESCTHAHPHTACLTTVHAADTTRPRQRAW